jgi:hypothetical protein
MILQDPLSGRVFNSERYSGISGSPFLYDKWITGSVTIAKGYYNNLELKLDAYSNSLYFNRNDQLFEFQDAVKSFILMPNIADSSSYLYFKTGLSGNGLSAAQFVQVLVEGRISLYKADSKLLTEVNEINKGVIKTFGNASRYFVLKENKLESIKIGKNDVFDLMKDKQEKVQAYIDQNKISTKKVEGLILVLKYYNSL